MTRSVKKQKIPEESSQKHINELKGKLREQKAEILRLKRRIRELEALLKDEGKEKPKREKKPKIKISDAEKKAKAQEELKRKFQEHFKKG